MAATLSRARTAAGAIALLVALCVALPARAIDIKEVTSPKGIKGWLIKDKTVPLFSMSFAFRGGSALDPVGKEGLAEMTASLLDEGAGNLDSQAFQGRLENNSIDLRFGASADDFSGSLRALVQYRDMAGDLLRLSLMEPRFDAAPVARVRGQYLSAVRRRIERPGYSARRIWRNVVFRGHPYGRELNGTDASIKAITVDDMRAFVKRRLARDVLVIGAVGDIDEAAFGALMDRIFSGLPAKAQTAKLPEAKIAGAGRVIVTDRDIPQSVVVFGQKGIKRKDPDFYTAYVLNYVLGGGGLTSRLATEIREKRGLAYSVYTRLATMDHAGLITGRVATANSRVAESISLIRQQWAKIAKEGITEEELKDAKSYLTGSFYTQLNSTSRIAQLLVGIQLDNMGLDYLKTRNAKINAVTLADARRVAKQLFRPGDLTISVVGRPEGVKSRP